MEEIEVPLEQVQEHMRHAAHEKPDKWIGQIALFSAIVAVIAAVAALLAGHHSNEAMITQIKASDSWGYYQAKGIKANMLQIKVQLLIELGKDVFKQDDEKLAVYKKEQEEISEKAKEFEHESAYHLAVHQILARAVTLFQVAIAIAAITILTRQKKVLFVSFGFSLLGLIFFLQALLK